MDVAIESPRLPHHKSSCYEGSRKRIGKIAAESADPVKWQQFTSHSVNEKGCCRTIGVRGTQGRQDN